MNQIVHTSPSSLHLSTRQLQKSSRVSDVIGIARELRSEGAAHELLEKVVQVLEECRGLAAGTYVRHCIEAKVPTSPGKDFSLGAVLTLRLSSVFHLLVALDIDNVGVVTSVSLIESGSDLPASPFGDRVRTFRDGFGHEGSPRSALTLLSTIAKDIVDSEVSIRERLLLQAGVGPRDARLMSRRAIFKPHGSISQQDQVREHRPHG